MLIESSNSPPNIRKEPGKWTNRLVLPLVAEDLPIAENRVLSEGDAPVIEWTGHHPYAYRGLQRALGGLPGIIPDVLDGVTAGGFLPSQAHIQGTHRISTDPAEGVVDEYLRLHEIPNVFALGAGVPDLLARQSDPDPVGNVAACRRGGSMMISRRNALLGGVCLAAVACGIGFALQPGRIAAHARRVIARVYGADIAARPAAQAFCDACETLVIQKGLSGFSIRSKTAVATSCPILGCCPTTRLQAPGESRQLASRY